MSVRTVADTMLTDVECVDQDEDAAAARARMEALGLHALAVCDAAGRFAGVLYMRPHRRDEAGTAGQLAAHVDPLSPSQGLEDAQAEFKRQRVGWLPVVSDGVPVGVTNQGEVFAHLEIDRELGPAVLDVAREISPDDEMFLYDRTWTSYLSIATAALACIRRSMQLVGKHEVRSVFDLACGHARVLRVLKAAFPHAELTACDIKADGVEFCARVLGAVPVVSHVDARKIDVTGPFDLVWSGSLFNHFAAPRWSAFLDLVEAVLEPDGLFVMAIHNRNVADGMRAGIPDPKLSRDGIAQILRGYDEAGFGYADYAGEKDWGDNVAKPAWVKETISERSALELVDYQELGWSNALDVVTCRRVA
jgi:SAM-dependent methyltransferase